MSLHRKSSVAFTFGFLFVSLFSFGQQIKEADFSSYFTDYGVTGSFLLYDVKNDAFTSYQTDRNRTGFIPASTFKIPNSLIALELGIVADENTLMPWDGVERSIKNWNRDMTFQEAIRVSCVPCYQQIAREVGVDNYHNFLLKLDYGRMDVRPDNLTTFWLTGNSNISPFEQIDFLKRLYMSQLPLSERSKSIVKKMLLLDENSGKTLSGKTGWAEITDVNGNVINNIGWFVGWVETEGNAYIFATNVEAAAPDTDTFIKSRAGITKAILKELNLY